MKFAWLCSHESYQPEALVDQAVAAEEAGFDAVLGSDHFHPWVDDTSAAGFVWAWLGAGGVKTAGGGLGTAGCPPPLAGSPTSACGSASAPARRSTSGRSASRSPATASARRGCRKPWRSCT